LKTIKAIALSWMPLGSADFPLRALRSEYIFLLRGGKLPGKSTHCGSKFANLTDGLRVLLGKRVRPASGRNEPHLSLPKQLRQKNALVTLTTKLQRHTDNGAIE